MPYNNLISRTDAAALIPEEVSREMMGRVRQQAASLQLMRRIPIARGQTRFPVLSALPVAYFVNGDTGLKQTTEVNWANKYLNVEEIACIVPIPEAVVDDTGINVWDEVKPDIEEAIGRTLDAAVFFGTNKPASWPTDINAAAAAAGNNRTEAATAAQGGEFGDVDAALDLLEGDGFDLTGVVAARSFRGRLRSARNSQGDRLDANRTNGALTELDGAPIVYPMRGLFPTGGAAGTNVRAFLGSWDEYVIGVRQDITYKVLDQAVITDNTNAIIYNLPQQDMVALRVVFRVGWQVSNRVNYDQPTEANRYPVAVIRY